MPHHLLTVAEMRRADAETLAAGTPGAVLMERAGAAVAAAVRRLAPFGGRVLVLCGKGNNGGDGFVAARHLAASGYSVDVLLLGELSALTGDSAWAAAGWRGPVGPARAETLPAADILVDALFGAGLSGDVLGEARALVEAMAARRAAGARLVAVDVPSGLDGDTGQARGAAAAADVIVTFFRRKPGHLLFPGRALCGEVLVADIGIPESFLATISRPIFENSPEIWRAALPRRGVTAHKYGSGHLLVAAGGLEGVGAPRLAARAGARIGAGLVTLAVEPEALAAHAGRGPDHLMLRAAAGGAGLAALLADPRLNALVIGPALGLEAGAAEKLEAALASGAALVLDADALTLLAGAPERVRAAASAAGGRAVVLTPHEGEFSRLFRNMPDILEAPSKLERARGAAALTGAVVVLKGADTVIAAPDGRAAINTNGTPALATAGSGDVLAGIIGGLLAQGMPAWQAACAAVWLHAAAGKALGHGLVADDLVEAVGRADDRVRRLPPISG